MKVLGALALVVVAMFQDAITIAIKMLMTAAPIIGAAIGEAMRTGFKNSIAHAKAEGALRGQAASAAEANGTTFEEELSKARLRAASKAFEGLGKRPGKLSEKAMLKKAARAAEITGNSFEHELKRVRKSEAEKDSKEVETATTNTGKALSGLAKIIEEERAAIAAALAKATGEGAGNGAGNDAAGKNQPDGRITLQDLTRFQKQGRCSTCKSLATLRCAAGRKHLWRVVASRGLSLVAMATATDLPVLRNQAQKSKRASRNVAALAWPSYLT